MCDSCKCHKDFISCQPDAIVMNMALDPASTYYYTITDCMGTVITKEFTTDEDGKWSILKSDLPENYLVQGSCFTIKVTKEAHNGLPVNMMITTPVNCIEVNVKCIEGEPKDFIGW